MLTWNAPLRFTPFLRPMVWGGRRLGTTLGKLLPTAEPYGESWEISDHACHRSTLADNSTTIRDLMATHAADLLGTAAHHYATFPWLIKLLDANDWLSVQVHPDEDAVRRLWPGEGSKTEAWFVLDASPGSKVYAGLLPGVDEGRLRSALAEGTVADCLHQFTPQPGDCLFLRAGTVHAVGGGVLMAEVQQTSDATFRLFDWNRVDSSGKSRQLHIEEALASIHWDYGPVQPIRAAGFATADETPHDQELVRCPYFALRFLRQNQPFQLAEGRLQVLIGLKGQGTLTTDAADAMPLHAGDTILLPASLAAVNWRPQGCQSLLVASLP